MTIQKFWKVDNYTLKKLVRVFSKQSLTIRVQKKLGLIVL